MSNRPHPHYTKYEQWIKTKAGMGLDPRLDPRADSSSEETVMSPTVQAFWLSVVTTALILGLILFLAVGCSSGRKGSGTESQTTQKEVRVDRTLRMEFTGGTIPGDVELGPEMPPPPLSHVDFSKRGLSLKLNRGDTLTLSTGEAEQTDERTEIENVIDRAVNTPWYVYGLGALMIAAGFGLAWLSGQWGLAVFGGIAGVAWVSVYVLVAMYPWVFLVTGIVLLGTLGAAGVYCVWFRDAKGDVDGVTRLLGTLVRAVEEAPEGVQTVLKERVGQVARRLGVYDELKTKVTELKQNGGI